VFLVVDEDGNEFIVKVDSWEDDVTDPTAPEDQYAAVEAFLVAQGITATVMDHAIKAGSYQGNSGGGIFLSDGSLVPQSDIDDYWFGEAWTGKAFNGPNVDFEVDFDDLPEVDGVEGDDLQAKALSDEQGDAEEMSGQPDDEADANDGSDAELFAQANDENLSSLADPGVESIDLLYPDETDSADGISGDVDVESQVDFDFDDSDSDPSGEVLYAIEAGDLISEEDDLQGLLSDGEAPETDASNNASQFDSISLEENFKLDLDDADSGESFD
jgi:hypothetical protein